jgi:hypothetical protein
MSLFYDVVGASSPTWRCALLAALAAFLLYVPSLGGGLIYDSILQVGMDDYIHHPANFADIVTLRVVSLDEIDRNRPVQLASLILDASIWGQNPFGFRLTSALLHAGVCALLFLAALRLIGARTRSANLAALIGALFFAWHPLCVETVCEPSNREDVLAGFFLLMALVLFLGPRASSTARVVLRVVTVVLCCFLAAGSKEVGWIAPAILAVAWWSIVLPREGFRRADLATVALAAVAVGALAAAILSLKPASSDIFLFRPEPWSWSRWADLQPEIFAGQIERILFPIRLCADYYRNNLAPWTHGWLWLLPALLALVAAVMAWRRRAARTGVALFFLALLPSANLLGLNRALARGGSRTVPSPANPQGCSFGGRRDPLHGRRAIAGLSARLGQRTRVVGCHAGLQSAVVECAARSGCFAFRSGRIFRRRALLVANAGARTRKWDRPVPHRPP